MNKPVILLGNGCRNLAMIERIEALDVPVLTTWMAVGAIPEDSRVFCGRPGVFGQRAANLIAQKADMLYVYGARLDGETVGYNLERFAGGRVVVYDVDQAELDKLPDTYEKHLVDLNLEIPELPYGNSGWLDWCKTLYAEFRGELEGQQKPYDKYIDPQFFISALSKVAREDDVLAIGSSGGAPNTFLQCFKVKRGQMYSNVSSIGAMGADIPMAIGASLATGRRVITVTGDGGWMLNIHELQVIRTLCRNIKIFVFNNEGYGSIRAMQDMRFEGNRVGCDRLSGLALPSIKGQAAAYGIDYLKIDSPIQLTILDKILEWRGPAIFEVMVDPNWKQFPRMMATLSNGAYKQDWFENMTPKLHPYVLDELMEWGNDG